MASRNATAGAEKSRRAEVLPLSLPPRGLSRVEAAAYVGISASSFDKLVADGTMPRAKRLLGRTIWDRKQLDACFDAIDDSGSNPWD